MTRSALLRSWLVVPPLGGRWLAFWMVVALPIAAFLDWTMDCPDVLGECCTPYFLFILLTTVMFGWKAGIGSAVVSIIAFLGVDSMAPMHMHGYFSETWRLLVFLVLGITVVGAVEMVRRTLNRFTRLGNPNEYSSGVIFSLEEGQAWASWPGRSAPVRLGPQQEVSAMMEDFLKQVEVGKRLAMAGRVRAQEG